jgi:hypothetical protein
MPKDMSDLLGDSSLTEVTMNLCIHTLKELSDIGVSLGMSKDTYAIYVLAFSKLLVALSDEIMSDLSNTSSTEEAPEPAPPAYSSDDLNA